MSPVPSHHMHGVFVASISVAAYFSLCIAADAQVALDPTPGSPLPASTHSIQPSDGQSHSLAQSSLLPDAPGASSSIAATVSDPSPASGSRARAITSAAVLPMPEASPTQKVIEPNQDAPILTSGDKARLGLKYAFSPPAIGGWFVVAGYEHLTNSSPNYGTDRGAFGRRLGDAAIHDASRDIVSDSLLSPIFREDPRYYRLGPTHNFFVRVIYAGTRPLVTQTDSGRIAPNFALLAATAGGSAMTNVYYPQANHGVGQSMENFGGSIAGSAVGDLFREFSGDLRDLFRPRVR